MKHKISIPQAKRVILAKDKQTILEVSLEAGVPYPHACQGGRCGDCKSRLLSGQVEHLEHNKFTLSEAEKSAGLILACRAIPTSDVKVEWLGDEEVLPLLQMTGVVESVKKLTPSINHLRIRVPPSMEIQFRAGQSVKLKFGPCPARSYSMSNAPSQTDILEFLIKETAGGCASHYVANTLTPGSRVEIEGPFGQAWLKKGHTGPILLIAAGSGLAPILSIAEDALKSQMRQDIHLYFGVQTETDLFKQQQLKELAEKHENLFVHFAVERGDSLGSRNGRVGDLVLQDWSELRGRWQAYIAGPPPMVEALVPALVERGILAGQIFSDPFYDQNIRE